MAETYSIIPDEEGGQVKALDLEFRPISETIGKYELSDGTVLEIRLTGIKACRGFDETAQDKIKRKPDGEPLYNMRFQAAVTARVKDELLAEVKK